MRQTSHVLAVSLSRRRALLAVLCAVGLGLIAAGPASALVVTPTIGVYGVQPATGKIVLVDPTTGAILSSYDAPGDLQSDDVFIGLSGAEEGSTLIYRNYSDAADKNTLFRLNPSTGATLSEETMPDWTTDGLTFETGTSNFIFSSHSNSDIHRQTGFSGAEVFFWSDIAPGGALGGDDMGRHFARTAGATEIKEFSPSTDTSALNTFAAPATDVEGLAFDGTVLYASTASGTLYRLNPDTGAVLGSTTVSGGALWGLGVASVIASPVAVPDKMTGRSWTYDGINQVREGNTLRTNLVGLRVLLAGNGDTDRSKKQFSVPCNIAQAALADLQVNWGYKFNPRLHEFDLTSLQTVECQDTTKWEGHSASFDTIHGTGTGTYQGQPGYSIEFWIIDNGSPGPNTDRMRVIIKRPDSQIQLDASQTSGNAPRFIGEGEHVAHDVGNGI